ncbi:DUF4747 family protein [Rheinheimera sp.]|uniref:DUF4747 family protein n=1 Tax=Rheinheimera sp. TaxID=1869214 RepID=UPI00307CF2CA
MGKKEAKLSVGAINITLHPHSPETYVKLFRRANKQKVIANIGHRQSALITAVSKANMGDRHDDSPIVGDLVRFSEIDLDGAWFNLTESKIADDYEVDAISIPEHLKPNTTRFSFVFIPSSHLLFYEAYSYGDKLSAGAAVKAFDRILNDESLTEMFGEVEVTHIPEVDALETALRLPVISNLKLIVNRPNADHFDEAEKKFLEKMNARNLREISEEQKAVKGQTIIVDEDTKEKAKIAQHNGRVDVKGKDIHNRAVDFSTISHPLVEDYFYEPEVETAADFLFRMAVKLVEKIKGRRP